LAVTPVQLHEIAPGATPSVTEVVGVPGTAGTACWVTCPGAEVPIALSLPPELIACTRTVWLPAGTVRSPVLVPGVGVQAPPFRLHW
jgi:hypothetical protein